MQVPTRRVKFKDGKFKGEVMTITASDFDPSVHEDAADAKASKKSDEKADAKASKKSDEKADAKASKK